MSDALVSIGDQLQNLTLANYTHKFQGYDDEEDLITLYFNTETNTFLLDSIIDNCSAKMVGELSKRDDGRYDCISKYGIVPENTTGLWEEMEGLDIKTFDISGSQIEFDGALLNKV